MITKTPNYKIVELLKNTLDLIAEAKTIDNQAKQYIDEYIKSPWLKKIMMLYVSIKFRKKGIYSFLITYITCVVGVHILSRPKFLLSLASTILDYNNEWGKFIIDLIIALGGAVNYIIFGVATFVVLFVVVCHTYVKIKKNKIQKELKELINAITFEPDENWFDKKCKLAIRTLNKRYSETNNFRNPLLENVYSALVSPDIWNYNFKLALQNFIRISHKNCYDYNNNLKGSCKDIKTIIDEIILTYNSNDYEHFADIFKKAKYVLELYGNIRYDQTNKNDFSQYELSKMRDAFNALNDYNALLYYISTPVLYIKGDAGTGKSHLLADIVNERMQVGLKSLLILGLDFTDTTDIKQRIMSILSVKGSWDDFLSKLNKIGELENQKILFVIDGVNEGLGESLWNNHIENLEADILQYKNLSLVISARTFSRTNMLDHISEGKASIILEGYKGMEDKAITYLSNKQIILPNISRRGNEFSNPLFLKLYCETYDEKNNYTPSSFLDVVDNYINHVNNKLSLKYNYQATLFNYPQLVCTEMANIYMMPTTVHRTKYLSFNELLNRLSSILPNNIPATNLLQDMIDEGVLMHYRNHLQENVVDYNFDLVGDYLIAKALIDNGWNDYSKIRNIGIYDATAVLLPLVKGCEVFDYNTANISIAEKESIFVRSLSQRFSLSKGALIKILSYRDSDINLFFELVPIITSHAESKELIHEVHSYLKSLSMPDRDAVWSMHYTINCGNPSLTEMMLLAKWAVSISRTSAACITENISWQMASVLCWAFSTPNRELRDISTKACINLLKDKPLTLREIIDFFDDVNDPYIQQRLYAVVHGCVFTGKCSKSKELALQIYQKVFMRKAVRCDILLRDYARCSIDYIVQHTDCEGIDMNKIEPPYDNHFAFSDCPNREFVESHYRLDITKGYTNDEVFIQNKILNSMETEYSNGTGGYGDFGRYTFESSLYNWRNIDGFSASKLRNYALFLIFDKYKFDPHIYVRHDSICRASRGNRPIIERFGKKYQWIAMYEILGLMQDNYLMESRISNTKNVQCEGTWDPFVRDIDTTNSFSNYYGEDTFSLKDKKLTWTNELFLPYNIIDTKNWLSSKELVSKKVIHNIIEVIDESGDSWIVLYGYNNLTSYNKALIVDESECSLWSFVQAYTVMRNDRARLAKAIYKQGTQGRNMPEYNNGIYELYYKDYYNSASYRAYSDKTDMDKCDEISNNIPYQLSYRPYTCEGEMSAIRLSKQLFDLLKLKDGERVGEYIDDSGKIIAMDPSVNHQNESQLLVRKQELINALSDNRMSLVWPILMEKQVGTSTVGLQIGGYAYMDDKGRIKTKIKLYIPTRNNNKKVWRMNKKTKNYIKLIGAIITHNKIEQAKIRHNLFQIKLEEMTD